MSVLVGGAGETGGIGPVLTATISANTETYTFNPAKVSGYSAGKTTATLIINNGIYLYSNSISTPALTVSGWSTGDTVYIVNNGFIIGRGGDGGKYNPASKGSIAATSGGDAISLANNITLFNNGFIAGGGGGGGASNLGNGGGGGGGAGGGYGGAVVASTGNSNLLAYTVGGPGTVTANIFVQSSNQNLGSGANGSINGTGGGLDSNTAYVSVNGVKLTSPTVANPTVQTSGPRGHNLYVINPSDMSIQSITNFDTAAAGTGNYVNGLLPALQSVAIGKLIALYSYDSCSMDSTTKNYLINNYGDVNVVNSTVPTTWSNQRYSELFISIRGAASGTAVHQITANTLSKATINTTANVVSTGFSTNGTVAPGGVGGTIGNPGANGSIVSSGDSWGSGGGGGRILPGVGGLGGLDGSDIKGLGGSAGGGGGGATGQTSGANGGSGGSSNAQGNDGVAGISAEGGGGGGGWGAAGGKGSIPESLPGNGGKCIVLNGKKVILANPGTLYGAIS